VGAGWLTEEIEILGHPVAGRGRRMDEMLALIRRFWTEDSVAHEGEFFQFPAIGISPKPAGPVPIWVGGKSQAALARAVRQDGWLGMNYELPEVHRLLRDLEEARAKSSAKSGTEPGSAGDRFEVFVIPNAAPDEALYQDLEARGVTATMGMAWAYNDRDFDGLDAKRRAMDVFAARFLSA
jgi:alkanesulfonate monooxygenase SsuD/methylene tetrahydromethanopterin reductase-like flavin-dependent oxidoreductase (luciferase family)